MQNIQKTESFFSRIAFQIVSLEKDNQDQADIALECFRCFRLRIFPHLCVLLLWFEHRIKLAETKKMFLQ